MFVMMPSARTASLHSALLPLEPAIKPKKQIAYRLPHTQRDRASPAMLFTVIEQVCACASSHPTTARPSPKC
jgi:hypothetical protein